MDMSELIEDFMEYLQIERGRSIKTSEAYRHYLERFLEFAGFDLKVDDIRPELSENIAYGSIAIRQIAAALYRLLLRIITSLPCEVSWIT